MKSESLFRWINVRADSRTGELDLGFLAECLLFYDRVFVIGSETDLKLLIDAATLDGLHRLFKSNALRFLLHPMISAVFTADKGTAIERHDFGFVSKVNQESKKPIPFGQMVQGCLGDRALARAWISEPKRYIQQSGQLNLDLVHARTQLWSGPLLESLLSKWLRAVLPDEAKLQEHASVKAWELAKCLQVVSTIDFSEVDQCLQRAYGTGNRFEGMNMAHFIGFALDSYADIHYAARTNSDIAVTSFGSPILEGLATQNLRAVEGRLDKIYTFQEHVLQSGRAISEAINSHERQFVEVIPIVEKARLFKHWLTRVDPDDSLVASYIEAVTKETWADTLPGKAIRWVTTNGLSKVADVVGGAGFVIEAFDGLVLDRLVKGWRPNQFIDGNLKKFVKTKND